MIYTVEVTPERTLEQKRRAIQAFAVATLKGARWAMQNPEAAASISQKVLPDVARDEIIAGLKHFSEVQYYNVDGLLSKKAWDFTVDELVKGNELKKHLEYSDYVIPAIANAAAQKLGPYKRP